MVWEYVAKSFFLYAPTYQYVHPSIKTLDLLYPQNLLNLAYETNLTLPHLLQFR